MADMASAAGLRLPDLTKKTQAIAARRAHPVVPAGVEPGRLRRPAGDDSRGAQDPRRDRRRQERRHPDRADHGRARVDERADGARPVAVAETTDKPIFVVWGSPGRYRARVRRRSAQEPASRVPHVRELRAARCARTSTTGTSSTDTTRRSTMRPRRRSRRRRRRRRSSPAAAPGTALSEYASKQVLRAVRHQDDQGHPVPRRPPKR